MKKRAVILTGVILIVTAIFVISRFLVSESDFIIKNNTLIKYQGQSEIVTIPNGVDYISEYAFTGPNQGNNITLKKVIMPDSVIVVGKYAFYNCINLSDVIWSNSLETVREYAFAGCKSLTECVLPIGVTYIGDNCFANCTNLEKILLPDTFSWAFGYRPFKDCESIKEIMFSVTEYENGVDAILSEVKNKYRITVCGYEGTEVQKYALENGLEFKSLGIIPDKEFVININKTLIRYNGNGGDIIIPDGVEYIAANVFARNPTIKTVSTPNSLKRMGTHTFGDSSIMSVQLSEQLESIPYIAFQYCEQLNEVMIPKNVRYISSHCFAACNSLKRVSIPHNIKIMDVYAFNYSNQVTLYSTSGLVRRFAKELRLPFKFSNKF